MTRTRHSFFSPFPVRLCERMREGGWGVRTVLLLAALSLLAAPARAQTSYTVVDLTAAGDSAQALGVDGGVQVGGDGHALLWRGTAASLVDLNPAGFSSSQARAVSGDVQVGYGVAATVHALLWRGTAASVVDLTPAGSLGAQASGVDGTTQVGSSYPGSQNQHAVLWHGTAASAVDLHPARFFESGANAVSGSAQAGFGTIAADGPSHALLWHGTAASVVDLNPAGSDGSQVYGISGTAQVGVGSISGDFHALLWHGTAQSVVDLNPTSLSATFSDTYATAVSGNTQVGWGFVFDGSGDYITHPLVWHGTAASAVDLNAFLPAGIRNARATGVSSTGDITGYGDASDGAQHALLWHPYVPTLYISSLGPDVTDKGGPAFTLYVYGSNFKASTVARWNGQALATTSYPPFTLAASVPASLITNTGTADITAQTPGVATSGSLTFHIRPVISSLSPSTVTAGHAALTLTVTGSGFTPGAIVVLYHGHSGVNLATTYVSSTKLTAAVPASLLTAARRASIMVTLPHVATSVGKRFDITP